MTHALQFTEQDWERIDRDWTAWWVGDLDRPLVMIENPIFFDYLKNSANYSPSSKRLVGEPRLGHQADVICCKATSRQ